MKIGGLSFTQHVFQQKNNSVLHWEEEVVQNTKEVLLEHERLSIMPEVSAKFERNEATWERQSIAREKNDSLCLSGLQAFDQNTP